MSDDKDASSADIQRLAREYVDLWEEQVKTLAGDEGFATAMSKTFELMNAGAANIAAMAAGNIQSGQGSEDGPRDPAEFGARAQSTSGSGTEASGAASGHSDHDVHQLVERINQLERRIADLEKNQPARSRSTTKRN
jgi:hypothetical protein